MNNDHPENGLSTGDWETINSFGERSVCGNPTGVQAYPIDRNAGSTAVTHIGRFNRSNHTVTPYHCDVTPSYTGVTGISATHSLYRLSVTINTIKPKKIKVLASGA